MTQKQKTTTAEALKSKIENLIEEGYANYGERNVTTFCVRILQDMISVSINCEGPSLGSNIFKFIEELTEKIQSVLSDTDYVLKKKNFLYNRYVFILRKI